VLFAVLMVAGAAWVALSRSAAPPGDGLFRGYLLAVSAAFFGLAASEDLGIGQMPGKLRNTLDAFYPMIYPSHFGSGQFNIEDPDGTPGPTIAAAMADWRLRTNGGTADLRPWLQDFTMGNKEYTVREVREQISAADASGAGGWLLWNAQCVYTPGVFEGAADQP
jgi:hypothetical protein